MNFSVEFNCNVVDYSLFVDMFSKGKCQKKPVVHGYFVLEDPMTFNTETGSQRGEPGMYCIIGKDHAWPVTAEYFEENYAVVNE